MGSRKRKTTFGSITYEQTKAAIEDIVANKMSTRSASFKYNIPRTTMRRAMKKYKDSHQYPKMGWTSNRLVFSPSQENKLLGQYIIQASEDFMGYSPKGIRILAYQMAKKYQLVMPKSWELNKTAGEDWFGAFIKRNPILSLEAPKNDTLNEYLRYEFYSQKLKSSYGKCFQETCIAQFKDFDLFQDHICKCIFGIFNSEISLSKIANIFYQYSLYNKRIHDEGLDNSSLNDESNDPNNTKIIPFNLLIKKLNKSMLINYCL
ncbi:uncharacterized protein LOC135930838 [Gordionus sp. m RMFG-2023]|uniref:uncharacterized protein LOC135930838 n=1 Tax=Gordionus sp. m RMFG-2023 TaxID=3053472 RepID=UPI0031FBCA30